MKRFLQIFSLIVLLVLPINAQYNTQHFLLRAAGGYYWQKVAVTGTNVLGLNDQFIYSSFNRTKASKLTGSRKISSYMRWWLDPVTTVVNGTFGSDIDGWTGVNADTLEWVASGGGFTGAIHCYISNVSGSGGFNSGDSEGGGLIRAEPGFYNISVDVNIVSMSENQSLTVHAGVLGELGTISATGSTTFTVDVREVPDYLPVTFIGFENKIGGTWHINFYVDNIIITKNKDSTVTIAKILDLSSLVEDTTYNYDAVAVPIGGNASYSDGEDSTFVTPLSAPNIVDITVDDYELEIHWTINTPRLTGWTQIWRSWDSDDSSFTKIDSVLITVDTYSDSGGVLAYLDSMRYKVRHRITNYSDYSGIIVGTVTEPSGQFTFVPDGVNYANVDSTADAGDAIGSVVQTDSYRNGFNANQTSQSMTHGMTINAGDVIVAAIHVNDNGNTISDDNGDFPFTQAFQEDHPDATSRYAIFYRVAGGSEPSTIGFKWTNSKFSAFIFRVFSGVDTTVIWDVTPSASTRGSSGTGTLATAPTMTTSTDSSMGLLYLFSDSNTNDFLTPTNEYIDSLGNDDGRSTFGWRKLLPSAGATGTTAATISVDGNWVAQQFALKADISGGNADSTIKILAINTSGVEVTISDTNNVRPPYTLILPSALPIVVADTDTVSLTIVLKRDTSGEFSQTAELVTQFANSSFSIYANVLPGDPCQNCGPPDTTAPAPPTDLVATGYNSSGLTGVITSWTESISSDRDSIKLYASIIDSNNVIINPNFDSDVNGWTQAPFTGDDPVWSANGGGFTGSAHVIAGGEIGISIDPIWLPQDEDGWYYFSCDVNIISNAGALYVTVGEFLSFIPSTRTTGTGLKHISALIFLTVVNPTYTDGRTYVEVSMRDSGTNEFYIDNVSLIRFDYLLSLSEGTTEYNDTTLKADESRWYFVTQLDDSNNESVPSNVDSGLVPTGTVVPPPNVPSNLVGTSASLAIALIWNQKDEFIVPSPTDEDSFFVYIDGVKDTSLAANDTSYTQYQLTNNTSYEFKISAWGSTGGESSFSNVINIATLNDGVTGEGDICDPISSAITVATNVTVTGYRDSLVATWGHADLDSVFVTYILPAALNACCGNQVAHPCDGVDIDSVNIQGASRWTWFNPPVGVWDIKLRVKDVAGNVSSWSVADSGVVPAAIVNDTTAPNPLTNLLAIGKNVVGLPKTFADVTWNITNMSSDAANILIDTSVINDTTVFGLAITLSVGVSTWRDTLPAANDLRKYRGRVIDDSSNVSYDNPTDTTIIPSVSVTPPPDAPTGLGGVALGYNLDGAHTDWADSLFWTKSVSTHDSTRIYMDGNQIASVDNLVEYYVEDALGNNEFHTFNVSAWHEANSLESDLSNTLNLTTVDTTSFPFTKWYIDNAATGGNNGTSWANAWENIRSIPWSSVNPGDIVYISGGPAGGEKIYITPRPLQSSQKTVMEISNLDGTADAWITVRNSWDVGHNGQPVIDGEGTLNCIRIGEGGNAHYIILYGLKTINSFNGGFYANIQLHYSPTNITIDSCIINDFGNDGVQTRGTFNGLVGNVKNVIIQNCDFIGAKETGNDAIHCNGSVDHIFRNNYIHLRRWTTSNPHADGFFAIESQKFMVYNNIVVMDSNMQGHNYILRASQVEDDDSVIVYNNFFYYAGYSNTIKNPVITTVYGRYQASDGPRPDSYFAFNTIIGKGRRHRIVSAETPATWENNIITAWENKNGNTNIGDWLFLFGGHPIDSTKGNLFFKDAGWGGDYFNSYGDWNDWVAAGGTGVNANPSFVVDLDTLYGDAQGLITGDLKADSPAIGAGIDLQSLFEARGWEWRYIGKWRGRPAGDGGLGITTGAIRPTSSTPTIGAYDNE